MKKRSPLYPLTNLLDTRNFSVNVFEKAGDSTPLKYADLAKFGQVAVRDADSFASAARQYGWMTSAYGKGYSPISAVCTILRKPQGNEETQQYLTAFTKPDIFQKIISEYQGKSIPTEGLEIFLIRQHQFSDAGAKQCATVFLQNANFLGLINADGVFNSSGQITITPIDKEEKPKKQKNIVNGSGKPVQKTVKQLQSLTLNNNANNGNGAGKNIMVFIKGQRYSWPLPSNMSKSDWDDIEVQIKQFKDISN